MFSAFKLVFGLALGAEMLLAADPAPFRVCADPNNLPYSNQKEQGFEIEMAAMIARDFGTHATYLWYPQRGSFFSKTLDSGVCDAVMSVPEGFGQATTTRPYYRSTYVFVSRHDRNLRINSFDDPRLHHLRIGVHVLGDADRTPPPVQALLSRGLAHNLVGYSIFGNLTEANPASDLIRAVMNNQVDVAVAWGPLAGYFARHSTTPLDITPIPADPSNPALPLAFDIAIGVRAGNYQLRDRLNKELTRRAPEIHQMLRKYGVPEMNLSASTAGGY